QERGDTHLYRLACGADVQTCSPERIIEDRGSLGTWSLSRRAGAPAIAYAFSTPKMPAELFIKAGTDPATSLTSLNAEVSSRVSTADVEPFTFKSFDGMNIEAFL